MTIRLVIALVLVSAACGDNTVPSPVSPPDAGEIPPDTDVPLEREHAGGQPSAIAVAGTRAYVGVGPRLAIWDVSASPPALLGETAPLPGVIRAVAVTSARAYVAETVDLTSRIHVIDVSSPAAPVETASFAVAAPGEASTIRDLAATATRLYVADADRGIDELDLADPDAPAALRTVPPTGVSKLTIDGSRLYYGIASFFGGMTGGALDLQNDLANLGSSPLGSVEGVTFTDRFSISAGPDGIFVHDFTDPSNAVQRFHLGNFDGGPYARAMAASGTTAWVPADDGLYILELDTPQGVAPYGPFELDTAGVNATAAAGGVLAIVTDRGRLLTLGSGDPWNPPPARVADVSLCANCVGVATAADTVYIADIVGGLRTATLADLMAQGRSPAIPPLPENGSLAFVFEDVEVAAHFAYVADWLYGLRIYDVTDARAPALVGSLVTGGAPSGLAVDGARVYLAEGTNGGMLRIIDVADPAHPAQLGAIETSKAMKVTVRGSIAYVADESLFAPGGLRIFDVSNPTAIRQLAIYDTDCTSAGDVALQDNLAIVACQSDGFHWVDISNPTAPQRVATMQLAAQNGSARTVATWPGHTVLGHDRGVLVIDDNAKTVASFDTAWPVRALSVPSAGRIVAACGFGGMYQWKL